MEGVKTIYVSDGGVPNADERLSLRDKIITYALELNLKESTM
jgi:hypothetical protein